MIRVLSLDLRFGENVSAEHLLFAILSGFAFNLFLMVFVFRLFFGIYNCVYCVIGDDGGSNSGVCV